MMKTLDEYLRENGLSEAEFARRCADSQQNVNRWRRGVRLPRAKAMAKIRKATEGVVTADSFYQSAGESAGANAAA